MKKNGFLLFFLIFYQILTAQKSVDWRFATEKDSVNFQKFGKNLDKKIQNAANDSLQLVRILGGGIKTFQELGFAEFSVDSVQFSSPKIQIHLHLGKKYEWIQLKMDSIPLAWRDAVGFDSKNFDKKPLNFAQFRQVQTDLLAFAENHGFPFAQIFLTDISIQTTNSDTAKMAAQLQLDKGQLVNFETLILANLDSGRVNLSENFLAQYLDFRKGEPFSAGWVRDVSRRLGELAFLREVRAPLVNFSQNGAKIKLFIAEKKSNILEGLIGVLPSSDAVNGARRINLMAIANADFQNLLGRGERMRFKLEQLRPQSPNLDAGFVYPYLFNLPFGTDFNFQLFKFDSTYLDTKLDAGVRYFLRGGDFVKLFGERFQTSNLTLATREIVSSRRLPTTLDVTTLGFGIEYQHARLDYRFNPRRGLQLSARATAGIRRVRKNIEITGLRDENDPKFNFESLYDTVSLQNFQYKIRIDAQYFLPIGRRSTFRIGVQNGLILGGGTLSEPIVARNELFRIGGNRLLRGFDEERIFTPFYQVSTLEYRLILARNSYLFGFLEGGLYQNLLLRTIDVPRSFGAGISFETTAGIVSVNLAVGGTNQVPIDFRNVKTHFSYVSLF